MGIKFQKSETIFSKKFCLNFFLCFLWKSPEWNKNFFENQTAVYFCLHHEFYNFLLIFGHFCCFAAKFLIFSQFFSGVQQYVWQGVTHTDIFFSSFKIFNIFILREIWKKIHCPPSVTLALLLFLNSRIAISEN